MCLAIPGKIKRIDDYQTKQSSKARNPVLSLMKSGSGTRVKKITGKKVLVSYPNREDYALAGDEKIKPGDYVLVQMGIIVKTLSPTEYHKINKLWKQN